MITIFKDYTFDFGIFKILGDSVTAGARGVCYTLFQLTPSKAYATLNLIDVLKSNRKKDSEEELQDCILELIKIGAVKKKE